MLLVATEGNPAAAETPVRLEPPVIGDGPHLSYAIQWFAFAAIAVGGAAAVAMKSRG
jgi:cytochrome oxidase assembly protein ShyY1